MIEYPKEFKDGAKAFIDGLSVYHYLGKRIMFFNQEDLTDVRIIASLKVKSWKH